MPMKILMYFRLSVLVAVNDTVVSLYATWMELPVPLPPFKPSLTRDLRHAVDCRASVFTVLSSSECRACHMMGEIAVHHNDQRLQCASAFCCGSPWHSIGFRT